MANDVAENVADFDKPLKINTPPNLPNIGIERIKKICPKATLLALIEPEPLSQIDQSRRLNGNLHKSSSRRSFLAASQSMNVS